MNRLAFFLSLLAFAFPAAAERTYSVHDFDRVVVEGPYAVRLVTGRPSAARAEGDREALERLVVDVQGGTLRIRRARSAADSGAPVRREGPVTVNLATRDLRSARLVGPGSLEIEGARGLRVEFVLEGSGRLSASGISADRLSAALVGSGRIELEGRTQDFTATIQGSGDLDASALRSEALTLTSESSGAVAAQAVRTAAVTANGLGAVEVAGRPSCTVRGVNAAAVRCGSSDQRQRR